MTVCYSVRNNRCHTDNFIASWFDHPRDLLNLVNLKRDEMPRPIVGIGHSMGGAHLLVFPSRINPTKNMILTGCFHIAQHSP